MNVDQWLDHDNPDDQPRGWAQFLRSKFPRFTQDPFVATRSARISLLEMLPGFGA
jgi:hypothetical protein